MNKKHSVLFLCTGNSARSQMAEAMTNARLGENWEAFSAGTRPADQVHPKALQALREISIDHAGSPQHVDQFKDQEFDLVVTVCDAAAEECPLWLGPGKRLHHGFPDPAQTDQLEDFCTVRDRIENEIIPLLETYKK